MKKRIEFYLLTDLAHLLIKYGPDPFSKLARILKQQETIQELIVILEDYAALSISLTSKQRRKKQTPSRKTGIIHFLEDLEKTEPVKAQLLYNFNQVLLSKNALPSLKELKEFAADNGLSLVRAKARDKAIYPFIKDISTRPIQEIKSIVERASITAPMSDRSLEGWANIILNKER